MASARASDIITGTGRLGAAAVALFCLWLSPPLSAATFGNPVTAELNRSDPRGTAVADLDLDGHLDVVVAMAASVGGDGGIALAFGDGSGGFTNQGIAAGSFNPIGVGVGDFNGDGAPDIAVVMEGNSQQPAELRVFLRASTAGSRSFTQHYVYPGAGQSLSGRPRAIAVADFNGDGKQDIATADTVDIDLYLGDGSGGFADPLAVAGSTSLRPWNLLAADIDGDGDADLVAPGGLLRNDGSGGFSLAASDFLGGQQVVVADLDNDGRLDVISADVGVLGLRLGRADGGFDVRSNLSGLGVIRDLWATDIDLDGNADLLLSEGASNQLQILFGDGSGGFALPAAGWAAGGEPSGAAMGDWNGDGLPDIAASYDYQSDQTPYLAARLQQVPAAASPTLLLSAASYRAAEDAGSVVVHLLRHGSLAASASVTITASAGSATAGGDFAPLNATLDFAAGQAVASATLTLLDDAVYEGDETLQLGLSAASGAVLGSPASATLTLIDDEQPAAQADSYGPVDQGQTLAVAAPGVLGNDGNPNGVSAELVAAPAHASAFDLAADGSFSYTHDGSETASDSFQYRAIDAAGRASAAVAVSLAINRVDLLPRAQPDAFVVAESGLLNGDLLVDNGSGADTPGNAPIAVTLVGAAPLGNLQLAGDGSFSYAPPTGYTGADGFRYRLSDDDGQFSEADVSITVAAVNDPPTADRLTVTATVGVPLAITLGGSDPEGAALNFRVVSQPTQGALTGTPPILVYTANAGASGTDFFTYVANDGEQDSATAFVIITLQAGGDSPPIAAAQSLLTNEDVALALTLSGSDPDGDPISAYTVTTAPGHGLLSGSAPNLLYTPNANFFGADSFQFTVTAGGQTSAPATVSIDIASVNDAPLAVADSAQLSAAASHAVAAPGLLGNDSDIDGGVLSLATAPLSAPAHGTLQLAADGGWQYTPDAGFSGADGFSYQLDDGQGGTATGSVSLTVTPGVSLQPGMNLLGARVDPAQVADSYTLLQHLGPSSAVERIQRHDPASGKYLETRYDASGAPSGDNSPLLAGEGWVVYALAEQLVPNDPNQPCGSASLSVGQNLVGFACDTAGLTASALLARAGGAAMVSGIQSFGDGRFRSLAYDAAGELNGEDFAIVRGGAYLLYARQPAPLALQ